MTLIPWHLAPTSFNIQHWRFVIVRDPEPRGRIRTEFGNDQAQITDASLLVILTGDTRAWTKAPRPKPGQLPLSELVVENGF